MEYEEMKKELFDNIDGIDEDEIIVAIGSIWAGDKLPRERETAFKIISIFEEGLDVDDFYLNENGYGSGCFSSGFNNYTLNFDINNVKGELIINIEYDEYDEEYIIEEIKNKASTIQDLINLAENYKDDINRAIKNAKILINETINYKYKEFLKSSTIKNYIENGETNDIIDTAILYLHLI